MSSNTEPTRYSILTLEDIVRTYESLPEDRAELLLKEVGDAVRIMAPMADVLVSPFLPLTWINDTKGRGRVNLKTKDGTELASIDVNLNGWGA